MIPTALGNIVGGGLFVGAIYWVSDHSLLPWTRLLRNVLLGAVSSGTVHGCNATPFFLRVLILTVTLLLVFVSDRLG